MADDVGGWLLLAPLFLLAIVAATAGIAGAPLLYALLLGSGVGGLLSLLALAAYRRGKTAPPPPLRLEDTAEQRAMLCGQAKRALEQLWLEARDFVKVGTYGNVHGVDLASVLWIEKVSDFVRVSLRPDFLTAWAASVATRPGDESEERRVERLWLWLKSIQQYLDPRHVNPQWDGRWPTLPAVP